MGGEFFGWASDDYIRKYHFMVRFKEEFAEFIIYGRRSYFALAGEGVRDHDVVDSCFLVGVICFVGMVGGDGRGEVERLGHVEDVGVSGGLLAALVSTMEV